GFDDPVLTVVKSGLLGTDDVKVDIARDSGETVGTYKIKATGTVLQGNYKLKFVDGTFTVDKRPVMLVWSTDEFVFDTEEKDITAEIVNVVTHAPALTAFRLFAARALNSDDVYVSGYKNNTGVNAGTYTAEATSLGGADAGNYILINATHQWKILKAASILKVTDETVTYDGGKHTLKAVLEQGTGTVTAFGDENPDAGTYTVTFRAAETANYLGAEAKGTLTILPKNVEDPAKPFTEIKDIDISKPAEKTYDSTEQTQDFKVTDKAIGSGKKLTLGQDFDVAYKNNVNAGTAEVYFTFKGNYAGNIKKTFVINPAELTLKVKDTESRQGSALAAPEVEVVSGQLYGNDTPGQITYNMAQMTAPGEYPITAEIAAGTENANYKVTFLPGVYRLTAAPVVPTPDVNPDDGGETKPSVKPEDTTEETAPESTTEIDDGDLPDAGGKICYWHFIMLAIDLIWLIIMLIAGRRLKEEDEEQRTRKQKKGRWLYGIFAAVAAIIIMVLCIPGFCNLDIIIAIASVVFVILSAIFSCRHKFSRKAEQER
ncbi:MAG: MBG-2 domain-containing protein, partial [Parasporobacterium sp.]|nr:MBG-2 domain-containing protein [Parasporobacterium sp.]